MEPNGSLRRKQSGRLFADDIIKYAFLFEKRCILTQISV